jgi:hypothetical protein
MSSEKASPIARDTAKQPAVVRHYLSTALRWVQEKRNRTLFIVYSKVWPCDAFFLSTLWKSNT